MSLRVLFAKAIYSNQRSLKKPEFAIFFVITLRGSAMMKQSSLFLLRCQILPSSDTTLWGWFSSHVEIPQRFYCFVFCISYHFADLPWSNFVHNFSATSLGYTSFVLKQYSFLVSALHLAFYSTQPTQWAPAAWSILTWREASATKPLFRLFNLISYTSIFLINLIIILLISLIL